MGRFVKKMTKETYIQITEPLRQNKKLAKCIQLINRILTAVVFFAYPSLLLWLYLKRPNALVQALTVPFNSFVILTAFRYAVNAKRPYEVFDIPPVIPKDTKGKSFPSRHVFSVFLIAMTYLFLGPAVWIGILLLTAGVLLAIVRVWSGVHFPRDVIAGAVFGMVSGWIGFVLL